MQPKSGDRHKSQTKSSSAFQLTLNEPEYFDELRDYLRGLKDFQFGEAAREEAPETGHEHVHVYVQFKRSIRLAVSKLKGAHIEKCYGTAQKNVEYIEKDGDVIWKEGELMRKGGKTISEVKKMSIEEREELPLQMYNIVQKLAAQEAKHIKLTDWHKEIKVTFIEGPSGSGKSHMAMEMLINEGYETFNLVKYGDSFWHGVTEDGVCCIYDDWRDSHMKPSEFINFIDYNKHPMNVKGGTVQNNYKRIIITTVQSLDLIYSNIQDEPRKQWERRITEHIKIGEDGKKEDN